MESELCSELNNDIGDVSNNAACRGLLSEQSDSDEAIDHSNIQASAVYTSGGRNEPRRVCSSDTSYQTNSPSADEDNLWFEKESLVKFVVPFSMCLIGKVFI